MLPDSSTAVSGWSPSLVMGMYSTIEKSPLRSVRAIAMVVSPSCTNTFMSGW